MNKSYTLPVHGRMVVPTDFNLVSPLVLVPGEELTFTGLHTCRDGSRQLIAPIVHTEHPMFYDVDVVNYASMIFDAVFSYSRQLVAA